MVRVDFTEGHHAAVAFAAFAPHVNLHGKGRSGANGAGVQYRTNGIGPFFQENIKGHGCLLARSHCVHHALNSGREVSSVKDGNLPLGVNERRLAKHHHAIQVGRRIEPSFERPMADGLENVRHTKGFKL